MKQIFILMLSALLWSCNQTKSNKDESSVNNNYEQTVQADTAKTVQLIAEPSTLKLSALPDSIKVIITNNTTDTITTGLHYFIEKLADSQWNEVSPKDIVFHDLGWRLKPNDSETFVKKLYKDQIKFTTGKYRIVKYYLNSDYQKTKQQLNVYAEFEIEK